MTNVYRTKAQCNNHKEKKKKEDLRIYIEIELSKGCEQSW